MQPFQCYKCGSLWICNPIPWLILSIKLAMYWFLNDILCLGKRTVVGFESWEILYVIWSSAIVAFATSGFWDGQRGSVEALEVCGGTGIWTRIACSNCLYNWKIGTRKWRFTRFALINDCDFYGIFVVSLAIMLDVGANCEAVLWVLQQEDNWNYVINTVYSGPVGSLQCSYWKSYLILLVL